MVDPFWQTAQEHLKNKSNNVLGGPGIRTQVPRDNASMPLPTELERAFVKGMDKEYYIQKLILCCKTKK